MRECITLVRFVEKIPFTGQDWDLVEEKEMLAWKPDDRKDSFLAEQKELRADDRMGQITKGKSLPRF